jgi:hypothetical protein
MANVSRPKKRMSGSGGGSPKGQFSKTKHEGGEGAGDGSAGGCSVCRVTARENGPSRASTVRTDVPV